jgi:type II secretion system protein G
MRNTNDYLDSKGVSFMSALTLGKRHTLRTSYLSDNAGGFTLLELLVVVAIIGVLAAIAIPTYHNYVDKAQVTVAISTLDAIRKNFESFHIDYQKYPVEPINFTAGHPTSGQDAEGDDVFSTMMLDQIDNDITDIIYNTVINGYIVTAKAKDKKQTALILTPLAISKAP